MFFLFLSGSFWLIITLNETYEREVTLRIELANVPRNAVITTDVSDTIHAVVRDKGYMIATYLYGNHFTPIRLNFQQYADGKGHGTIPAGRHPEVYQPTALRLDKARLGKVGQHRVLL